MNGIILQISTRPRTGLRMTSMWRKVFTYKQSTFLKATSRVEKQPSVPTVNKFYQQRTWTGGFTSFIVQFLMTNAKRIPNTNRFTDHVQSDFINKRFEIHFRHSKEDYVGRVINSCFLSRRLYLPSGSGRGLVKGSMTFLDNESESEETEEEKLANSDFK